MTEIVTRIYDFQERAGEAVEALKEAGFLEEQINQVTAPGGHNTGSAADQASRQETIATAIRKGGVRRDVIGIYTDAVSRGGSLVSVRALFGKTGLAIDILDSFGPVPVDLPVLKVEAKAWDKAAPLSSWLGWSVFSDDPTPFSTLWYLPVLTKGRASLSALLSIPETIKAAAPLSEFAGIRLLLDKAAPLSDWFNLKVLSDNPTPLSSLFGIPLTIREIPKTLPSDFSLSKFLGIPVLAEKAAPLSAWFSLPVLMDKAAPLSTQFNIPLLSEKAAPLSDLVKIPVSFGNGTPLSTWFGIPMVLKKRAAE
jgi:hypothetical protein